MLEEEEDDHASMEDDEDDDDAPMDFFAQEPTKREKLEVRKRWNQELDIPSCGPSLLLPLLYEWVHFLRGATDFRGRRICCECGNSTFLSGFCKM
jgi:hypothetical protein